MTALHLSASDLIVTQNPRMEDLSRANDELDRWWICVEFNEGATAKLE